MLIQKQAGPLFNRSSPVESASPVFRQPSQGSSMDSRPGIHCRSHRTIYSIVSQTFEPAYQQDPGKPLPAPHGDHFPDLYRQSFRHVYRGAVFPIRQPIFPRHLVQRRRYTGHPPFLITLYLLITVARQKYQLQRIQRLESDMQLRYYQNVSVLHGSIRSLRHDLSNHLAIPEGSYRDSLLTICDQIDSQIHSQLLAIHKDRSPVLPRKIRNLPLPAAYSAVCKASAGGSLHHRRTKFDPFYHLCCKGAAFDASEKPSAISPAEAHRFLPRSTGSMEKDGARLHTSVYEFYNKGERSMLHIYQMILLLGTLPIFCCIQLFLVFKCIGVSSHRKKVFWLIIIYTIIFKAVEIGLELVPEYHTTLTIQITHSLVHAFNTFILLTIIGIYGEGYFPRNFIKTTFYYDFLHPALHADSDF